MKRVLMDKMLSWKESRHRKPLLLWGARQVGKTWIMKEFGRLHYENTVYISFYNNSRMRRIFDDDYDVHRIISAIEINLHVTIHPDRSLLIFDEVQSAPRVVEALKYFCEDAPTYHVMAAGSLLGVALHEGISFPVGKVDELHLYPLSFREYLMAQGEERLAAALNDYSSREIRDHSERYKELLKEYYAIGGMPEVVSRFVEDRDFSEARDIQLSIVNQYEGDFGKHVKETELPRIRMVWNALPAQLAKENKKFFFGQIRKGARHKEFETAIQWLVDAGIVYRVNKVTKPAMPLKSYTDFSAFKLFMIDVGLLGAMSELDMESVLTGNDVFTEFKGALSEQYVHQQLISDTGYTPYYYLGDKSTYETDFMIQKGKNVVPLEVKSEVSLKSKSLRVFCEKFKPEKAIRISSADYMDQGWMMNVPLWAVSSI